MDVAVRGAQKLFLQCHKQHKPSKGLFAYLILTEGIGAGPLPGTEGSGEGPKEAEWVCASLTMGFHLTSTDLSVELKYERVVASIVCILGGALKEQKERD